MSENHPLFEKHPTHQWVGPLVKLLPALRKLAYEIGPEKTDDDRNADTDWAWKVLRGGAVVSYRIRSDMHMRGEIRIARAEPLKNEAKWMAEVRTFVKHFELTMVDGTEPAKDITTFMLQRPNVRDRQKTAVRFIQLRVGEVSPGRALCYACRQADRTVEIQWWPAGGVEGQRCEPCARKPEEKVRQLELA